MDHGYCNKKLFVDRRHDVKGLLVNERDFSKGFLYGSHFDTEGCFLTVVTTQESFIGNRYHTEGPFEESHNYTVVQGLF